MLSVDQQQNIVSLVNTIETVIKGKREIVKQALTALFAGGHLLIEDVPGVGKTTLGHVLALVIQCRFHRIQFTSDLLPSDIIGISIFNQGLRTFEFKPGPIFANVILADEINRTTPKTQSALLEAMSEGQVTADGQTLEIPRPFMVLATQNPIEHHGTYPLPESQLDRFLMRIKIGYPTLDEEKTIFRSQLGLHPIESVKAVLNVDEVLEMQQFVRRIPVDEVILNYALQIVEKTRQTELLSLGVSPRGSLALLRASQARAFVEGRDYCLPDDVKALVPAVLGHRVVVNSRFSTTMRLGDETEKVLRDIVDSVPVPI